MIRGVVNSLLEATIRFDVQDASGQPCPTEVVIDTGFNADLTLPPGMVQLLGLRWLYRQKGLMADGNLHSFEVYSATVDWDGQPRLVEVQALDVRPLMGTRLLRNSSVRIDFMPGGVVEIQAIPTP